MEFCRLGWLCQWSVSPNSQSPGTVWYVKQKLKIDNPIPLCIFFQIYPPKELVYVFWPKFKKNFGCKLWFLYEIWWNFYVFDEFFFYFLTKLLLANFIWQNFIWRNFIWRNFIWRNFIWRNFIWCRLATPRG